MSKPEGNLYYRPDIDGLRALAVCFVILYHAFPHSFRGGFIGVDVFFVISGYLIGGIILRELSAGTFSLLHFYSRRILRIFPALILMLAVVLLVGHFVLFPDEYQSLGKHTLGGAAFVANLVYWSEVGYWDVSATLKPLLNLWSLGVEEQFYIIIPVLLMFIWKKQYRLLTVIVLLMLTSLACNLCFHRSKLELDFYAPFTRFWEIFAGIALAALSEYTVLMRPAWLKLDYGLARVFRRDAVPNDGTYADNLLALAGLVCLVVGLLVCRLDRTFPGQRVLWPVFGAFLIIAAGQRSWLNRRILSNKLAVGLGLISYPLYLWHWPLLSYATILGGELAGERKWLFIRLTCVLIALLLALLTYFLIERPIRFGKGSRNLKVCALLLLMIFIANAGFCVFKWSKYINSTMNVQKKYDALSINTYDGGSMSQYEYKFYKLDSAHHHNLSSIETVAVIGDSHANADFPGIAEKNESIGLDTAWMAFLPDDVRHDDHQRKHVIDILKSANYINHIFIFMRGVLYLYGEDIDFINPKYAMNGKFKSLLQNTVDELNDAGKHVYIVSENPVFDKKYNNVRNFIRRPFALNTIEFPMMIKEDVYKHQKEYLDILKEIKGADIINGLDVFCPNGICVMFDEDGMPLYVDGNHLSPHGSRYLVKNLLEPYLLEIAGWEKE